MSVPNQKIINIGERIVRNKDNIYATMNLEALNKAITELNGNSGLKLWLILNSNADSFFPFELSQKYCETRGLKKDSYYRAVNELIEKGYLRGQEGSNQFSFFENGFSQNAKETEDNSQDENEISQNAKEFSHVAKEISQNPQRNNTYTTKDNTTQETSNVIDITEYQYNQICEKVVDVGGGVVQLRNGKRFKLPQGMPFSQPQAYLQTGFVF